MAYHPLGRENRRVGSAPGSIRACSQSSTTTAVQSSVVLAAFSQKQRRRAGRAPVDSEPAGGLAPRTVIAVADIRLPTRAPARPDDLPDFRQLSLVNLKMKSRVLAAMIIATTICSKVVVGKPTEAEMKPNQQFSGLELFLDDEMICWSRNVRRELQLAQMHEGNPILKREYPWESRHVCLYGSVLYDAEHQHFRMWYNAYGEDYQNQQVLAYAESKDGIHWTKPMLDLRPWPGYKKTNILMGADVNLHGPCVIRNPEPRDANRRYLLLFDSYPKWHEEAKPMGIDGRWCYAAESPDGLHWTPRTGRPAFAGKADSGQSVVWEPSARLFRAYTRLTSTDAFGQRIRIWKLNESPDFVHWSEPMELFRADERDGYPDVQVQQLTITRYDGIYIGLLSMFRIAQYVTSPTGAIDEGPQINDIQLVTSRDGIHFTRVADRALFMRHRGLREFGTLGYRTAQLVQHRDKVFIYCDGRTDTAVRGGESSGMEIGVATIPKDRFVAMTPKRLTEEAILELAPMRYPDGNLRLNARVGKVGSIQVEVADFGGVVIKGFTRADATAITGDSFDHEIRWQKDGRTYSLSDLPGAYRNKPIRLRLWLRQAAIFALRSSDGPVPVASVPASDRQIQK